MAENITTYEYTGKVKKVLLTRDEKHHELLFTRYKIECWGATGGNDKTGKDEGYYSSNGYTYTEGAKGYYASCFFDISHDTYIYLSIGGEGGENSGGWYAQSGNVVPGGPTSVSLTGTEESSTPDYSKLIIRAAGGNSGSFVLRSNPVQVFDNNIQVKNLPYTFYAPGRMTVRQKVSSWKDKNGNTLTNTAESTIEFRKIHHPYPVTNESKKFYESSKIVNTDISTPSNIKVWKSDKTSAGYKTLSLKKREQTLTGLRDKDSGDHWIILNIFSCWDRLDNLNYTPTASVTWSSSKKEVIMAVFATNSKLTFVNYPTEGIKGKTGTITWNLQPDISYTLAVKLIDTEKTDLTWTITPYPMGGHSHGPNGDQCSDTVKAFHWGYNYTFNAPRSCSYGNQAGLEHINDTEVHDCMFGTGIQKPNTDRNGFIRITKYNPLYKVNNIVNDDYRDLFIGRPIVGRDHLDDMFYRDLVGMRKNRWDRNFEYDVKIAEGFSSDAFEYLGTHYSEGAYNCLIESDSNNTDFIVTEPGIYEYIFPSEGVYLFECWGAAGGHDEHIDDIANAECGYGGYVAGICYIKDNIEKATIYVGGQGLMTSPSVPHVDGGFNGGSGADRPHDLDVDVGSGGGATDIRIGGTTLNDRVLVAGGGGGQGPLEEYMFGHVGGLSTHYKSEGSIETFLLFGCENVPNYIPIRNYLPVRDPMSYLSSFMINCKRCEGTGIVEGSSTIDYAYTGGVQSITLEAGKTYKLEVWGAQGGGSTADTSLGGKGGYAYGYITPSSTSTLYIIVGGRGGHGNGQIDSSGSHSGSAGYNGGGTCNGGGAYGGGMTHMSLNTYYVASASSSWTPTGTILVAGGGGGVSTGTGDRGVSTWSYQGRGQSGATGNEGSYRRDTSGGGGGWYGGASVSGDDPRYAYNGSCYIGGVTNGGYSDSVQTGNGKARVTIPAEQCPICKGTKKHLDPSRINEMVTVLKESYADHTGYENTYESPSDCLPQNILSHSGTSASHFGYSDSVETETFTGFTFNESILQSYIDAACADVSNFTNLTNNIGAWTTSLLSEYLVDCPTCNGTGQEPTGQYEEYSSTVYSYSYTGSAQSVTLSSGKYMLEVWGAQGGGSYGGYGGYSSGTITITGDTVFYIYAGGRGETWKTKGTGGAGWNGGGKASSNGSTYAGGGGGATDIRKGGTALSNRIIVAGGGGGGSASYGGGSGGGSYGDDGSGDSGGSTYPWTRKGAGGTQSSGGKGGYCGGGITANSEDWYSGNGSLGQGGNGFDGTSSSLFLNTTGGGGGWYGGGGGGNGVRDSGGTPRGAGGGSGYIGGVQNGSTSIGANSGDGYARITRRDTRMTYKTCTMCNGTKKHYNPADKTEIYNSIIEYVGDALNEYDNTLVPISSPALITYPIYVKGPGAGGGWYGGGVLRNKKNFIAAGGGSNYVYSDTSASEYPQPRPNDSFKMINPQNVSGISYKPMIDSYINMRLGSTGNGAVRIRKLSLDTYQPQSTVLTGIITEARNE